MEMREPSSEAMKSAKWCAPGKMRPPARWLSREPVSRRGMNTPSRAPLDGSSQRTATRWAAFSLEMPKMRGSHPGRICSSRMRQMPAMAWPRCSLGRKGGGRKRPITSASTRKLTSNRRRIRPCIAGRRMAERPGSPTAAEDDRRQRIRRPISPAHPSRKGGAAVRWSDWLAARQKTPRGPVFAETARGRGVRRESRGRGTGMLRPPRLAHRQNALPQDPSEFFEGLLGRVIAIHTIIV